MDIKLIDWKLLSFLSSTLIYEHWFYLRIPKVYYWRYKKLERDDVQQR